MTVLSRWRRHHFPRIVAETTPLKGLGTWTACAYRESQQAATTVSAPQAFSLLTEAQAAADDLVRTTFGHVCSLECGQWTRRLTARR